MKSVLLVILALAALLALTAVFFYIAGSRLPRSHRSVITITLRANRAAVWSAITDYLSLPHWWPAVKTVRIDQAPDGGEIVWNTDARGKQIPFRTAESRANEKLVRLIATDRLPFGGTWTYELADANGGGTRLTLTEDGIINPPIFRAIAKWFIGLDATQRDYLAHLEKHLAGTVAK